VERLQSWFGYIKGVLDFPILKLGEAQITVWTVVCFIVLLVGLFYVAGKMRKVLVGRVLSRSRLDLGAQQAIGSITRYVVLLVGLLIILQTVGINLTTLNVVAGAVGIGIGFGLQNIASNFVAGLIILFERPIKIGDRIEVGAIEGQVISVGARSTTVVTNDNIAIIVPNSKVVTENVACSIRLPRPSMLNNCSSTITPPSSVVNCRARMVSAGATAFFSACFRTTRRAPDPLAQAVRT